MKYISILFSLTLFLSTTQCAEESGSSSGDDSVSLTGSLFEVGNTVALQTASGDKVDATAADTDDDGTADGLDFNGDATIEIEYVLNVKSGARSNESVGFRFVGSDTVFYFLLDVDEIVMSTTQSLEDAEAEQITLVVDADTETITSITFTDIDGNETTEELEVPFTFATTPKIVAASPADGSTIGGETAIVVYLSESASTVGLGGDLAGSAQYQLSASADGKTDDLLTITPTETWPSGPEQSLVLNVTAASGTAFEAVTLMFSVDTAGPVFLETDMFFDDPDYDITDTSTPIEITFDETVSLNNLVLDMATLGDASASLSTKYLTNDTLILTPVTSWTDSCNGPVITVTNIEDEFGNSGTVNFDIRYVTDFGC